MSDDELMAKALMVAQNKIAERDKQIERMRPKKYLPMRYRQVIHLFLSETWQSC